MKIVFRTGQISSEFHPRLLHPRRQNVDVRYFDHNATHPLSSTARAAWLDAVEWFPANPSSPHRWGARASYAIENAREKLARRLNCPPRDIVFTSGATESNNAVIQHFAATTAGAILVSPIEHPSVLAATRRWLPNRSESIPVSRSGVVDIDWIKDRLQAGGVGGVIAMAANNETGVLQPWNMVRELSNRFDVPYFCDASQWLGKLPAAGLGACSIVTACAHKFGGPQGVGFMKCPPNYLAQIVGGPQEDARRAGTENVASILSFIAALEERESAMQSPSPSPSHILSPPPYSAQLQVRTEWRATFINQLKATYPDVEIVGETVPCLWNTVAALMPASVDCRRRWLVKLDKLGYAVSTGSACASGKEQPSHVLAAMGYQPDESDRMLRFSSGWETAMEDWSNLFEGIAQAAKELGISGQP